MMRLKTFILLLALLQTCLLCTVASSSLNHHFSTVVLLRGGAASKRRRNKAPPKRRNNNNNKRRPSNKRQLSSVHAEGTASIPNEIFNLVKSIVGAGVLGLPAGIAAFGDSPLALIPACLLVTCIGILSGYGFQLIGQVCHATGAKSYRSAWNKAVGPSTSWMPALACLLVTSCTVLAYSIILADTVPPLLQVFMDIEMDRTSALLGTTFVVLMPLCLLKNLSSLAPFSLVGIMGMIYTSIAMAIRYFGKAYVEPSDFLTTLPDPLKPKFDSKCNVVELLQSPNLVILICMLSTAYMAHYNAPKFYWELKRTNLTRFQTVVGTSFGLSILIFATVASIGFLTFGQHSSGLILNNYATSDMLMSASRVAVALSILFSYPLAFQGVRDGVLDLLKVENRTNGLLNVVTLALLAGVTGLAFKVTDLKFLLSLGGATWGNAVIYLFPTYMFVSSYNKGLIKGAPEQEKYVAILTGVLGLCLGIVGTVRALQGSTGTSS